MASSVSPVASQNGKASGAIRQGSSAPHPAPEPKSHQTARASTNLKGAATPNEQRLLDNWLNIQSINLCRHAKALRPFTKDEFGTGPAAPSEGHIEAVNKLVERFRTQLIEKARWVDVAAQAARREPTSDRLQLLLERKQKIGDQVLYLEGIWDFYFDMFVQRLSAFGERLRAIDRIAVGCYEKFMWA